MVFLGLTACAHRVEVPVLAQPALSFPATEVSVVASQRDCQAAADEVVHAVAQTPGLTVSPRARVRLELVECGVRVARGAEDRRPVVGHAFTDIPAEEIQYIRSIGCNGAPLSNAFKRFCK